MKQNRNRRLARVYAFQTLYATEFHKGDAPVSIPTDDFPALDLEFAEAIIKGTEAELGTIDEILQSHSPKRKIAHLGAVERNVLRMAAWEMLYSNDGVDPRIIINEAIQLTKEYGADNSYKFVNAVLDTVRKSNVPKTSRNKVNSVDASTEGDTKTVQSTTGVGEV